MRHDVETSQGRSSCATTTAEKLSTDVATVVALRSGFCHDPRVATDQRETTVTTITGTRYDDSISDTVVTVDPYRDVDTITGADVEVWEFYGNGGLITAIGFRMRKDGTRYARSQVVTVPTPANVRAALGR